MTDRPTVTHALRASLFAPLTVPALYCVGHLLAALADPARSGSAFQNLGSNVAIVFLFASPVAYAATFVAALPALCLLGRVGLMTWITAIVVGVGVGTATAAILRPSLRGDLFSVPLEPWHGALLGGAAAAVWYRLARFDRSRPAR